MHNFISHHCPALSLYSGVKTIKLYCVSEADWGAEAWERLGYIIGNNTIIEELKMIGRRDLDVGEIFLGLQLNQHIEKIVFMVLIWEEVL